MKKKYLLIPALISALAAEGAGLDRTTLDKKLTELAVSRTPVEMPTQATCYIMAMPLPQAGEYICPLCGERTRYSDSDGFSAAVSAPGEAQGLTAIGLGIAADTREFCRECTPHSGNFHRVYLPVGGVLARDRDGLPAGTGMKLAVDRYGNVLAAAELWIYSPLIDENGQLIKNAQVRNGPGTEYDSVDVFLKGRDVYADDPLPGDPPDWTRLRSPAQPCDLEDMRDLEYGIFFQADTAPEVWWEITVEGQTRRVKREIYDAALLRAFLTGQATYMAGRERELTVRNALPRLRELVGNTRIAAPEKGR